MIPAGSKIVGVKRAADVNKAVDRFWLLFEIECKKLAKRYPQLKAERMSTRKGEWSITGPYQGVAAFRDLAESAAKKLGFTGSKALAVNYWLDHMHGDHTLWRTPNNKEPVTEAIVINSDGTRQGYMGRQKI